MQVGNLPLAASQYDRRVVKALGSTVMMGALGDQKNTLAVVTPRVVTRERTSEGALVVVNAESKGRAVGRYSFFVGRTANAWKVRYDTLLGDVLTSYVQTRVQRDINPRAKKPSRRAMAAGTQATEDYRAVFAPRPIDRGDREP